MKSVQIFCIVFFVSIVGLLSCKKSSLDQSKIDFKKFKNYITQYPQKPLNRCSDFRIYLGFELPEGTILPHNLMEVSPPIGGQYVLSSNRKIITVKNAVIKHNMQHMVKFNIGLLTEMPVGMSSFSFPIEAQRQSWEMTVSAPTSKSMEEVSFKGEIKYAVCEPDKSILERSLKATQNGEPLRIGWNHKDRYENVSYFTIHGVRREDKAGIVDLQLSMEEINVNDGASMKLGVPAKSDFSYHAHVRQENKILKLSFTDPLQKNQNLEGLISVKGREISNFKIDRNTIIVYFKNEQFGEYDLEIFPGIKNLAGYPLKDSYTKSIFFKPPVPSVKIAEKGNILPPGDRWELPVSLISATGFRLRILKIYQNNVSRFYQENADPYSYQNGLENIGRVELDTTFSFDKVSPFTESYHSIALDRLVSKETGALYKIVLTIPEEHNAYPCKELVGNYRMDKLDAIDFDRPWVHIRYDHEYYDDDYYYGYHNNNEGHRRYNEVHHDYGNDRPCSKDYVSLIHDARLLMCTNVGLVAKSQPEENKYFFYASEITSANPLSNTKLTLKNIQGQTIGTGYTDGNGMVTIPVGDDSPFLAVAKYQNQTTYLPVQDAKALSLSTFQVEGRKWNGDRKVYFYGDRDVWRPGDSIYISSIVFSPDKLLPPTLPVNLKLYDPTNKMIKEWVVKKNQNGLYDLRFVSDTNAPTGYWRLEMILGGVKHTTPVRIETIRPNRLKMEMDFAADKVLKNTDSKKADIIVKWMHGLEAKDLKTEVEMLQKSLVNPFGADYKNYVFNDIEKKYNSVLGLIKSGSTSSQGKLDFEVTTVDDAQYPSMMLFNFDLRAFEKGGAFSSDMKSIKYSPYTHYIGAKFPGGESSSEMYIKDSEAIILAAVDDNGKPTQRKVHVSLYEIDYNWWYQFGNRGSYSAISNHLGSLKKEYDVVVGIEGKAISIEEYGRYFIKIEDKQSGHSISRVLYSYGDRWNDDNQEVSQLEVLPLRLEKTEFNVGEVASFRLPPMPKGNYLITLENGGKIVYKDVRSTTSYPTEISVPITSEMAPTVYLHVHLIQAWAQHNNDRPLRLFGIKPLKVYDSATVLEPRIDMPSKITTDETFELSVSEQNGRSMSYTIAVVDEGLLDITQFKTPDPWSSFFGKESLNVRTWDMYRDIFQRFLGEYTSLMAVGGDGSNAIAPASKARRFKPVVKYIGPYTLAAGEQKVHRLEINDYVGSVRAMIVAIDGTAIGRFEQTREVKKPLMLYTTLPRVLGPEEKLKVPVTVFSMDSNIKNVTASIAVADPIRVVGDSQQSINFVKEGEEDIYFEIETGGMIGVSTVEVNVQSGSHSYTEKIEIDIRPSATKTTRSFQNIIASGERKTLNYEGFGMEGTRSGKVSVSKGLNFSFEPQVKWLSAYPHGCLEQTISRVFPQIYLYKMSLLDDASKLKYRQQFEAALQKLRFLQLPEGGFAYWPGAKRANDWGTSYALQFLLEAKKYGYAVPQDMIDKCVKYQYKRADANFSSANGSGYRYSTIDQAYVLYTLALAGKPNYGAMNRLRLVPSLHSTSGWLLAHGFILLGEKDLANTIIESITPSNENYRELSGNFGSSLRDQAIIARVLLDKKDKVKAKEIIDEMVTVFNADKLWTLSTQERSQALITFAQFVGDLEKVEDSISYSINVIDQFLEEDVVLDEQPDSYPINADATASGSIIVENSGSQDIYSSITLSGQELRDETGTESNDLKMNINYYGDDMKKLDPASIIKGSDFIVEYTITHTGIRTAYENMALTAIFPSGWEILNQRLKQNSTFNEGDSADYQDIRDDRIMLYFEIDKGDKKTFRFKLNATYEGKYWAPPAYCEAMYNAKINAKSKGFWANVK